MRSYILLVDDNEDLSNNLKLVLEMEGFQVQTVSSVREALQAIEHEMPGLILADILMPGQNGYDLLCAVKSNGGAARVPFIFLSALTAPEDINRGRKLGADGYITKPFAIGDLLVVIHRYMKQG
jgi:DNA-binding response OmpR family regulator